MNAYVLVLLIVMANIVGAHFVNRHRLTLDMNVEADVKKDKSLRLVMKVILIESVVMIAIVLFVFRPLFADFMSFAN